MDVVEDQGDAIHHDQGTQYPTNGGNQVGSFLCLYHFQRDDGPGSRGGNMGTYQSAKQNLNGDKKGRMHSEGGVYFPVGQNQGNQNQNPADTGEKRVEGTLAFFTLGLTGQEHG